jgi:hypothetical protein
MNQTFQNSAQVLSIGIFFTLMILGLATHLPQTLAAGLEAHGVAAHTARQIGKLPPVSILFAAFLGYNPIQHLAGPHVLASLSAANRATLTGREFFPHLISGPFRTGLHEAFLFAVIACLIAAAASLMRGGKYAAPILSKRQEERSLDGLDEGEPPSPQPYRPVREEQHAG